jgi:hypothetical protein
MKLHDDPKIPHNQKKSSSTTPLPQASRHLYRDGAEAEKTLLEKTPSPPPERRPTKPLKPGEQFIHVLRQCLTPSRVTSASLSSVVWLSLVLVDRWADVGLREITTVAVNGGSYGRCHLLSSGGEP